MAAYRITGIDFGEPSLADQALAGRAVGDIINLTLTTAAEAALINAGVIERLHSRDGSPSGMVDLFGQPARDAGHSAPRAERVEAAMIEGVEAAGESIYFFSPMYVADKLDDPIDHYYAWTSTDHDSQYDGKGGIYLWTAPTILGPWTSQGQVFRDTNKDTETETPSVVYVADDPDDRPFYCFYQEVDDDVLLGQHTRLATSADGEDWTAETSGKLHQAHSTADNQLYMYATTGDDAPTGSHTGYFTPFRVGEAWYGYSLYGGGDNGAFALWGSHDCRAWQLDRRVLRYGAHLVGGPGAWERVNFTNGSPIVLDGRLYMIGSTSDFSSGSGAGVRKLVATQIAWDLRTIIGRPYELLTLDQTDESTNIRCVRAFTDRDGTTYVFYQCDQNLNVARLLP